MNSGPVVRALRAPQTRAFLLLAGLCIAFLWQPLARGGYYAPADVLQSSRLLATEDAHRVANPLQSDPALQHLPFLRYDATAVRAGHLPVWNPSNGAGVPHLANYQSAVFSPFSWPFYVWGLRVALIVSAFLKLFTLGWFTYLFLRRIGLRDAAALAGGIAFLFAGYHVVWLSWAHDGALVGLPAGLYAVECALRAGSGVRRRLALAGFAVAQAAGLLAGHPEGFFFAGLLVLGYSAARLTTLRPWRLALARGGELFVAGALGVCLAAVQLLPFLEYTRLSTTYADRASSFRYVVPLRQLPLMAFPNLSGNPATAWYRDLAPMNFNETSGNYVGLVVVLLALFGLATWRQHHSRRVGFFAVAAVVQLGYLYNVAGLADGIAGTPGLQLGASVRSHVVWNFSLAVLAAYGVDRLVRAPRAQPAMAAGLAVGATGLGGLALFSAHRFGDYQPMPAAAKDAVVSPNVRWLLTWYAVAAVTAVTLLLLPRGPRWRSLVAGGTALLLVALALTTGLHLRGTNPTLPERLVYPRSPVLAGIAKAVGPKRALWLGRGRLPAQANLWYGLNTAESYDALGVAHYDALYRDAVAGLVEGRAPTDTQGTLLRLLGVQYVVAGTYDGLGVTQGLAPVRTVAPVSVYPLPGALPQYSVVPGAAAAYDGRTARAGIRAVGFDPTQSVVVEPREESGGARRWPTELSGEMLAGGPGAVGVRRQSATEVELLVSAPQGGWLLALQTWYPGWQATVGGDPTAVVRADSAFSAVWVPPARGTRLVVFRYRPRSVAAGAVVSLLALGVLAIGLVALGAVAAAGPSGGHRVRS